MERIKNFRKRNRISQVALAEYLEVTQGFISQMENGTSAIPGTIISRLLANPYNWDTSLLTESPVSLPDPEPAPVSDIAMVNRLLQLLEEKERSHAALLEILKEKDETIRQLIIEITALKEKRGDAKNVITSSDANVG